MEVIENYIRKKISLFTHAIKKYYIKRGRTVSSSGESVEKNIRIHCTDKRSTD